MLETRRRPAADALKDWGLAHRFAGSSDRAAIAGLVYDALRRRSSSAWLMGEETPRPVLIGMLHRERGLDAEQISALCNGTRFAPEPLTREPSEAALGGGALADAPRSKSSAIIRDGSTPILRGCSATNAPVEGAALASRAPLDLRVNTLKGERDETLARLAHLGAEPTRWSPIGLRIRLSADAKEPGHPCPTGLSQGRRGNPGRRLAARCLVRRREARRADDGPLPPGRAARPWRLRR